MSCNDQWLVDRLAALEARIVDFETAIPLLTDQKISQYTLDTGQGRHVVTRIDVIRLEVMLEKMYDLRGTMRARLYGCNSFNGHPTF